MDRVAVRGILLIALAVSVPACSERRTPTEPLVPQRPALTALVGASGHSSSHRRKRRRSCIPSLASHLPRLSDR